MKTVRRWMKVGAELEGMYLKEEVYDRDGNLKNENFTDDGSVSSTFRDCYAKEYVTNPTDSMDALVSEVTAYSPLHTNHTCGSHFHLSYTPGDYSILASHAYVTALRRIMLAWIKNVSANTRVPEIDYFTGKTYERLNEGNQFCRKQYRTGDIEKQIISNCKGGQRYRQINYCHGLHGTIEYRFPAGIDRISAPVYLNMIKAVMDYNDNVICRSRTYEIGGTITEPIEE